MGAPKPCLGYPSRTAAVKALRNQGQTTAEIARQIGIPPKNVLSLEAGGTGLCKEPRSSERLGRSMVLPVDVLAKLGPHAAKRNISPNYLARLIVTTVVDEKMIDAVLDDAGALDWGPAQ